MGSTSIYEDLTDASIGDKLIKAQQENQNLLQHIESLKEDISKLCKELTQMKVTESNLKRNISELFNTATMELGRKQRLINELQSQLDSFRVKQKSASYSYKRTRDEDFQELKSKKPRIDVQKDKTESREISKNIHTSTIKHGHSDKKASDPRDKHSKSRSSKSKSEMPSTSKHKDPKHEEKRAENKIKADTAKQLSVVPVKSEPISPMTSMISVNVKTEIVKSSLIAVNGDNNPKPSNDTNKLQKFDPLKDESEKIHNVVKIETIDDCSTTNSISISKFNIKEEILVPKKELLNPILVPSLISRDTEVLAVQIKSEPKLSATSNRRRRCVIKIVD